VCLRHSQDLKPDEKHGSGQQHCHRSQLGFHIPTSVLVLLPVLVDLRVSDCVRKQSDSTAVAD
jgi:hypothetical protein